MQKVVGSNPIIRSLSSLLLRRDHVTRTATWSASGEGEQLWFLGTLATIRVPGEANEGRFALIEFLFPRHASPPLHTHPQDESYIVLEGRLTVQAAERMASFHSETASSFPRRWCGLKQYTQRMLQV